jgi:hypothetical protein
MSPKGSAEAETVRSRWYHLAGHPKSLMGTQATLVVLGLPPSQLLPSQLGLLRHKPSMLEKRGTAMLGNPTQALRTVGELINGSST